MLLLHAYAVFHASALLLCMDLSMFKTGENSFLDMLSQFIMVDENSDAARRYKHVFDELSHNDDGTLPIHEVLHVLFWQ